MVAVEWMGPHYCYIKGVFDLADIITTSNYRKGLAPLLLLSLLKSNDMYGYQIIQEMNRLTNSFIVLQEGSLYPILYKLTDQGYVSSYKKTIGKRMSRVYYHVEPKGNALFQQLLSEYNKTVWVVQRLIDF